MKAISVDLPRELTELEIVPISDAHMGSAEANEKALCDVVRYVDEHPNCYAILNGDLMDNGLKNSKTNCYTEVLSPMEQLVKVVNTFRPISNKILAITKGNHEDRTFRESGIDLCRLMAHEFGLSDRYAEGMAYLFLRFGETSAKDHHRQQRYCFLICHGSGGGKSVGSKANRLADLVSIADADVYVYGHTHQNIAFKEGFMRVDLSNDTVKLVDRLFINAGAYMNWGGYAEEKQYRPSVITTPHIHLSGNKRKMWVEL